MSVNSKEFLERQPLLDYLEKFSKHCSRPVGTNIIEAVERHVREMPTADVAPVVHARLEAHEFGPIDAYKCSNCGLITINRNIPLLRYCPHCGARMEGEEQ